jgi:hypothetical protein
VFTFGPSVKIADIDIFSRLNIQQIQLNLCPRNSWRLTLTTTTYANASEWRQLQRMTVCFCRWRSSRVKRQDMCSNA